MTTAFAEPHEQAAQDKHAARLGMWIFLGSELMLFGGLFVLYAAYRARTPGAFHEGILHSTRVLGSMNTGILLVSSTIAALAVDALGRGRRRLAASLLFATIVLGSIFVVIKLVEYRTHFHEGIYPGAEGRFFVEHASRGLATFWTLYFATTGLHAIHVSVGIIVLGVTAVRLFTGSLDVAQRHVVHNATLYWHLVDLVWIFVWPLYYLA